MENLGKFVLQKREMLCEVFQDELSLCVNIKPLFRRTVNKYPYYTSWKTKLLLLDEKVIHFTLTVSVWKQ